jgi:hypothetical protein
MSKENDDFMNLVESSLDDYIEYKFYCIWRDLDENDESKKQFERDKKLNKLLDDKS